MMMSGDPEQQELPTTRELSRYVRYYDEKIRKHSQSEKRGVFRQIQNLLKKGITIEQIETALKNYANDPWRRDSDPRLSKHIRSFFTKEVIEQWQTPIRTRQTQSAAIKPIEESSYRPAARPIKTIPQEDRTL